jgi:hypothetical protein
MVLSSSRCGVHGPWRTCSGRSWRISWRPRPTSPAYTRPRYHFRYFRVFPDPVPVSFSQKNSPFTEDQLEAEAYFSGLYKTQVLPVLPGISGSGSRIRIPLAPKKGSPKHPLNSVIFLSPAFTRPRYCQPLHLVFPDPVPLSVFLIKFHFHL